MLQRKLFQEKQFLHQNFFVFCGFYLRSALMSLAATDTAAAISDVSTLLVRQRFGRPSKLKQKNILETGFC